jgi:hypothetical protein
LRRGLKIVNEGIGSLDYKPQWPYCGGGEEMATEMLGDATSISDSEFYGQPTPVTRRDSRRYPSGLVRRAPRHENPQSVLRDTKLCWGLKGDFPINFHWNASITDDT